MQTAQTPCLVRALAESEGNPRLRALVYQRMTMHGVIAGSTGTPVGTCGYSVTTDSTDYTSMVGYTAKLTCGSWLKITAAGSIDGEQVNLDSVTINTPVQNLDFTPDFTAVVPVDPTTATDIHTFWDAAVGAIAADSGDLMAQNLSDAASDSASQAARAFGFDNILSSLNANVCDQLGDGDVDKVCAKLAGSSAHDALVQGVGGSDGLSEAAACPPLELDPPSNYLVVCMPTFLAGGVSTTKNILLTPGGALFVRVDRRTVRQRDHHAAGNHHAQHHHHHADRGLGQPRRHLRPRLSRRQGQRRRARRHGRRAQGRAGGDRRVRRRGRIDASARQGGPLGGHLRQRAAPRAARRRRERHRPPTTVSQAAA